MLQSDADRRGDTQVALGFDPLPGTHQIAPTAEDLLDRILPGFLGSERDDSADALCITVQGGALRPGAQAAPALRFTG